MLLSGGKICHLSIDIWQMYCIRVPLQQVRFKKLKHERKYFFGFCKGKPVYLVGRSISMHIMV
jgi:hypothetical protein